MDHRDLLARIRRYCSDQDVTESTFGNKAVNDGKLFSRLENGRPIQLDTLNLIESQLGLPGSESAWERSKAAA